MKQLKIAITSHDSKTPDLIKWCCTNYAWIMQHNICATEYAAELLKGVLTELHLELQPNDSKDSIESLYNSKVSTLLGGRSGGYQQIGSMIACGVIDMLILFCDDSAMYEPDIQSLIRLATLHNIILVTNKTTADLVVTSSLFLDDNYNIEKPKAIK